MKVGEARRIYSEQLNNLREQQRKIKNAQKKGNYNAGADNAAVNINGKYSGSADKAGVIFEYSDAIQKSIDETQAFMEKLTVYSTLIHNSEVSKQQSEVMEKNAEDMAKCMEIARRLSSGAKVPASDEKKLMEYNMKMYMAAKNMGMMNINKSKKEYDSLWKDEEEEYSGKNQPSASETADNMEVGMDLPEIVDFTLEL